MATCLATPGGTPGASLDVAAAALVTADNRAARGDPLCITRRPAPARECGRLITEAVAHHTWEDIGILAHTQPTRHRAGTSYKVAAGAVTLYGTASRAVVVHSSTQDQRRQPRLERDMQTSESTARSAARHAEQQAYCCRAAAETAAAQRRAMHPAYPLLDVAVEAHPLYGRGRPSARPPRPITAIRSRLKMTMQPDTERLRQRAAEAGGFVLLTNVPTAGDRAHSARDLLPGYKEPQGTEQHAGFLQDPVLGKSLLRKKPERIAA